MGRADRSDLVDIDDVSYMRDSPTGLAMLVKTSKGREVWLPKSMVERNDDDTFTMPRWMAEEKELV